MGRELFLLKSIRNSFYDDFWLKQRGKDMELTLSGLEKWFLDNEVSIQQSFFSFLSIPSISADSSYEESCMEAADFLLSYLKDIDFDVELLSPSKGLPVVFAKQMKDQSYPTLLIYHHYDVQPVDPLELWDTDPFNPTIKEGKIYARGASDNKGQCFCTLTALKALKELCCDLPINLKVFIEGEEESGGEGTHEVLQKEKAKLKADYLAVIDCEMLGPNQPAITLGYRGILAMNIECTNARADLHSGTHGGIALNPNQILVRFLSRLMDHNGKVLIPHFYDEIKEIAIEDRENLDLSFDVDAYQKDFGVGAFCSDPRKLSPKEATGLQPTLEINGLSGGYGGEGFKTVIPAKSTAKVSCRLVPGQDPDKIVTNVKRLMQDSCPSGARLDLTFWHGARAYRSSSHTVFTRVAKESLEEVFEGNTCRYTLAGGSIPIVTDLMKASGAEPVLLGFALSTDDIHSPNEHFQWSGFFKGVLGIAWIVRRLAFEAQA